jgi:ROS/MUCR transcriptional regulator protein
MTAETTGAEPWPAQGSPGTRRVVRPVAGVLADGTPYYAPIGEIVTDGTTVTCHLCGRPLKSVAAHLRVHGWTKDAYCETFGLERGQPLEGQETRKRRATSFAPRLIFDPAIRAGSAAGRQRAADGELSKDAARASAGRPLPEQRRRKASRAAAAASSEAAAQASRDRAARHRAGVAAQVARDQGHPTLGAYVLARVASGASLAAISREAGLHKDWLHRHLAEVDPAVAAAVRQRPAGRDGPRWLQAVTALGFTDVPSYLRDRHLVRHQTASAIGGEIGMSNHAVAAALTRHGLARTAHAGKRRAARERAAQVAAVLGVDSVPRYVAERRAAGWTWQAIAADCGQPPSWLRRQAAFTAARPRLLPPPAAPDQDRGERGQQCPSRNRDPLEHRQPGHVGQVQRILAES